MTPTETTTPVQEVAAEGEVPTQTPVFVFTRRREMDKLYGKSWFSAHASRRR